MKTRVLRRWKLLTLVVTVGVGALATTSFGAPQPMDVITADRYVITIDGYEIASFSELSAITTEVQTSEYWETSGDKVQVSKLAGKIKPPTVTLTRGLNSSTELWAWMEAVRQGRTAQARRSCSLTMYNAEGAPVAKFWLEKAWPSKLETKGVDAGDGGQALVETVELTTEYIQRVAP